MTKERFIQILEEHDILDQFFREFGQEFIAKESHLSGWFFFDDGDISFRACRIFDDHADGYNAKCFDDTSPLEQKILEILSKEGYQLVYNSGDEEDLLAIWRSNNPLQRDQPRAQ